MDKPACKYGSDCYRKNPVHLDQYWHPAKRKATKDAMIGIKQLQ